MPKRASSHAVATGGLAGRVGQGDGPHRRMICAGVPVEVDPPINRTDSAFGADWRRDDQRI